MQMNLYYVKNTYEPTQQEEKEPRTKTGSCPMKTNDRQNCSSTVSKTHVD